MKRSHSRSFHLLWVLCMAAISGSCSYTPDPYVRNSRVGGAAVGAGLGAILSSGSGGLSSGEGAIAGAVIGGILGDAHGKANSPYYRRPYDRYDRRDRR